MRPVADTSSGTSVRQLFHGYWTPPHVTGIRKPVSDDVKRNIPTQSTRRSFERKEEVLKWSLRKRRIRTTAMPTIGRLIQKIQRQVTF
jgi:hypothetical protein